MGQCRFPCSESAWMTCVCKARCCVSHLGMVHMASGRGRKRNQAFAVLSLVSGVIGGNHLSGTAKQADSCQCWERGTAPLQEQRGREVGVSPSHPVGCWEKGWQRGSVAWACWDSHWREGATSIGAGKPCPVYPQRALDSPSWWLKPQETRYLTGTLVSPMKSAELPEGRTWLFNPFNLKNRCIYAYMDQKDGPSTHSGCAELQSMWMKGRWTCR